jgi:hypothetical protein
MKRFLILIVLTLCALATCAQDQSSRRYFVSSALLQSGVYNLMNIGGGCVFSNHHGVGLSSSLVTRMAPSRQLFDRGCSADYNYYLRKADRYKFNMYVHATFDYFRRELLYYFDLFSSLPLENRETTEYHLYNNIGFGFSFRLGKGVRFNTSLSYITLNYITARYQFTKTVVTDPSTGSELVDRVTRFELDPSGYFSPLAFRMGVAVWLR